LVLSRAGRYVAVIDSGVPRNQASPGVRGFLSRDGVPPAWVVFDKSGALTAIKRAR
jgi:hypothetical protein